MVASSGKTGLENNTSALGRRAAEAMDIVRIMDRTLELMFAASTDANAKETLFQLRNQLQTKKEILIDRVAKIYAATYSADELTALADFLESKAGKAMRAKQADVEQKIQQSTTEFLQSLIVNNR